MFGGEVKSVRKRVVFVVTVLGVLGEQCLALRLTNMTAPVLQDPRKDMQLHCRFDMGGEELYAVKWYKDDHEFYRYSPTSPNPIQKFHVDGVNVDSNRTSCTPGGCDLLLTRLVRVQSSGAYRCEVSSEAPAFRLASQTHNVTVAAVPTEPPRIENLMDNYVLGDHIIAQCTSGLGDPKPLVTWSINKQPITNKQIAREIISLTEPQNALRSTSVQLKYHVEKKLVQNKARTTVEISCTSSTEGINPAVAPPLTTTRTVLIVDQNQVVNNQKLHSPFNGGAKMVGGVGLVLVILVRWC